MKHRLEVFFTETDPVTETDKKTRSVVRSVCGLSFCSISMLGSKFYRVCICSLWPASKTSSNALLAIKDVTKEQLILKHTYVSYTGLQGVM